MKSNQIRVKTNNGYIIAERNPDPDYDGVSVLFETNQGDLFDLVLIESKKENNYQTIDIYNYEDVYNEDYTKKHEIYIYDMYLSIDQNPIVLTSEETSELKSMLHSTLNMFSEYHPGLEPDPDDTLDALVELYCYWGDEYNGGYIRELDEEKEEDNRFAKYLAYEFKKYIGD